MELSSTQVASIKDTLLLMVKDEIDLQDAARDIAENTGIPLPEKRNFRVTVRGTAIVYGHIDVEAWGEDEARDEAENTSARHVDWDDYHEEPEHDFEIDSVEAD